MQWEDIKEDCHRLQNGCRPARLSSFTSWQVPKLEVSQVSLDLSAPGTNPGLGACMARELHALLC